MIKITASLLRTVALTALVSSFAFTGTLHAQTMDSSQPSAATDQTSADQDNTATSTASPTKSQSMPMKSHGAMNVEKRIKTLHDKLKITSAEESEWAAVAQTMRENEGEIDQLIQARHQNSDSMTAVDDLESYQKIVQAHADGLQKMASSFKTLYSDMSEAQQKNADEVFGRFEGHRGKTHSKKHHS